MSMRQTQALGFKPVGACSTAARRGPSGSRYPGTPCVRQSALPLPVDATFGLSAFREALAADGEPGRRGNVLLT